MLRLERDESLWYFNLIQIFLLMFDSTLTVEDIGIWSHLICLFLPCWRYIGIWYHLMYFLLTCCLDMHQAGCFHLWTVSDMIHPCLSACPNKSGEGLILVDFSHSDFWWISHTQILEDFSSSVEMPHHSVCPSGWPAASTESRHHVSLLQICYHGRISSTKIQRSNLFSKYDFNLKNRIRMS